MDSAALAQHPGGTMPGFLDNPMNWLLAFVPITVILEHAGGVPAPVVFFSAALAIVPITGRRPGVTYDRPPFDVEELIRLIKQEFEA